MVHIIESQILSACPHSDVIQFVLCSYCLSCYCTAVMNQFPQKSQQFQVLGSNQPCDHIEAKTGLIFPSAPFILPVFPSVGLNESPSGQRRFHKLRFPSRRLEPAQRQTPPPGASPAPRWWSGHPSNHPMSSIWQPAPERPPHMHTHKHTQSRQT